MGSNRIGGEASVFEALFQGLKTVFCHVWVRHTPKADCGAKCPHPSKRFIREQHISQSLIAIGLGCHKGDLVFAEVLDLEPGSGPEKFSNVFNARPPPKIMKTIPNSSPNAPGLFGFTDMASNAMYASTAPIIKTTRPNTERKGFELAKAERFG